MSGPQQAQHHNPTILAVDDDPAILSLVGSILKSAWFAVLQAGNGWEALKLYESSDSNIELLLTDVIMPDLNGPVLAARLRARTPALKVLFISGYHDTRFVQ